MVNAFGPDILRTSPVPSVTEEDDDVEEGSSNVVPDDASDYQDNPDEYGYGEFGAMDLTSSKHNISESGDEEDTNPLRRIIRQGRQVLNSLKTYIKLSFSYRELCGLV